MLTYVLERTQPASCSLHIGTAGSPCTVNGTGSNQLDPQGVKVGSDLGPQAGSSDRVHHIGGGPTPKGVVGLVEGEQVVRFGGKCADGCVAAVNAVSAPNDGLVLGNDSRICNA